MEIEGTAYEIIAKALDLKQDGKAWVDKDGNRFVLTKYGFWHAELVPSEESLRRQKEKYTKRISELEKVLTKRKNTIDKLYDALGKQLGYSSRRDIRNQIESKR